QQAQVLLVRLFRPAEHEHLYLVELVHPQDAAYVLAVRTGLPPEAGRPPGVPYRRGQVAQDLTAVVRGERHLRGADEVEVVGGQPVDLLGVVAQEPGALHRLRLDQHRRDHRGEPVLDRLRQRELQQPELELRPDPGQVVEPRPGDLRAPRYVDRAERLPQLQVVPRVLDLGPVSDLPQDDEVLLAAV